MVLVWRVWGECGREGWEGPLDHPQTESRGQRSVQLTHTVPGHVHIHDLYKTSNKNIHSEMILDVGNKKGN